MRTYGRPVSLPWDAHLWRATIAVVNPFCKEIVVFTNYIHNILCIAINSWRLCEETVENLLPKSEGYYEIGS